jgi:maltooligosyltrehalose synthase
MKNKELFQSGCYSLLKQEEVFKRIIAFTREWGCEERMIVAVPRFLVSVISPDELPLGTWVWKDTYVEIPQNVFTCKEEITGMGINI